MRFLKWPFIVVFLLVFSVGYNIVRVFIPTSVEISSLDNGRFLNTSNAKQPFQILPSRKALVSLPVGNEDISKQYADNGFSLDKNVLHSLAVSCLSFSYLNSQNISYFLHINFSMPGRPLFARHCNFLI